MKTFKQLYEDIEVTDRTGKALDVAQEYIKTYFDVRVLILGGKVIATMQRDVLEGDFRSNASLGAKVKKYSLTELEIEHSIRSAKAIGGLFTAVDFIPSDDPKNKPPYVLEVNSSPGTENIEKVNNKLVNGLENS